MQIKKAPKPITWEFSYQYIKCHCCRRSEATYLIEIGNDYFTGMFNVCNSCKNLDAQSIYDGTAGKIVV